MYCAFEMCDRVESAADLPGFIVKSKRGRDSGRICVIVRWLCDDFVAIADGRLRTVDKPKRKRLKHLVFTKYRHRALRAGFLAGDAVTDRMVRVGLTAYSGIAGEGRVYG